MYCCTIDYVEKTIDEFLLDDVENEINIGVSVDRVLSNYDITKLCNYILESTNTRSNVQLFQELFDLKYRVGAGSIVNHCVNSTFIVGDASFCSAFNKVLSDKVNTHYNEKLPSRFIPNHNEIYIVEESVFDAQVNKTCVYKRMISNNKKLYMNSIYKWNVEI